MAPPGPGLLMYIQIVADWSDVSAELAQAPLVDATRIVIII